jgi:cellulose synthase/poly-beta-1,6-N-acetylglucosamine synthase-like glycosyltransferase
LLAIVLSALLKLRRFPEYSGIPQISIIIAARNESTRISSCLESLTRIEYPKEKYEIIIVDDHSTDNTCELVGHYTETLNNLRLIRLTEKSSELRGKKNALKTGIEQATGELIFTTDADCIIKPQWLQKMSQFFNQTVPMVIGFSPLVPRRGILYRFLQFDNLFSAIVAAVFVKFHYPFTSTGRNLAYQISAYQESGGFSALKQYRSGDDMHLTQRFRKSVQGHIDYCADPDTFIYTQPPDTLSQLLNQQIRKNSKILQTSIPVILFGFILFIYHFLCYALPFVDYSLIKIWGFLVLFKLLFESAVLMTATVIFQQKKLIPYLIMMQILYPIMISIFSILGIFQLYKWKK